ncbi:MAG: sensor histidine kinase [Gemmatimonadaceae bacterium]
MSAIRSNGALWHSGEHRIPAPTSAPRGEPGRVAAVDVGTLRRELGRWKARAAELERRLAVAESQALSSQITPHFLCNSLQAVSTLLHRDPRTADAMVVALSDLLRMALGGAADAEVPLSRELALVERYVDVMRFRFGNDLRFAVDAAPETPHALVPRLLIQPIVENAILHGLRDRAGEIRVSVERSGDMLRCAVADNGAGLGAGPLVEAIGLAGTRRRLRAMYGERQRFELATNEAGGVTVTLALPYRVGSDAPEEDP